MTLAKRLVAAREKRNWSIHQAAERANMHHWSLRSLEGDNPKRSPRGDDVRVKTMLELIRIYWPDIQLDDFVERRTLFRLAPSDPGAARTLKLGYPRELEEAS